MFEEEIAELENRTEVWRLSYGYRNCFGTGYSIDEKFKSVFYDDRKIAHKKFMRRRAGHRRWMNHMRKYIEDRHSGWRGCERHCMVCLFEIRGERWQIIESYEDEIRWDAQ